MHPHVSFLPPFFPFHRLPKGHNTSMTWSHLFLEFLLAGFLSQEADADVLRSHLHTPGIYPGPFHQPLPVKVLSLCGGFGDIFPRYVSKTWVQSYPSLFRMVQGDAMQLSVVWTIDITHWGLKGFRRIHRYVILLVASCTSCCGKKISQT